MKLNIEYIKYRNFGSYGNNWTEYRFSSGLCNLYGAIGQGKSSVLHALYYNFYGESFGDYTLKELINDINEKELETESLITSGSDRYRIVRGMKPNKFEIYKNDNFEPINSEATKSLMQGVLLEIIMMNSKMFKSVVGLSSKNQSFFTMKLPDKRKMLEDLFGLEKFAELSTEVKTEITSLTTDIKVMDNSVSIYRKNVESLVSKIDDMERIKREDSEAKEKELNSLRNEIEVLTNEAKTVMAKRKELEADQEVLKKDIEDGIAKVKEYLHYEKDYADISIEKGILQDKLEVLENTDVCPTCFTELGSEHKEKHKKEFIEKICEINKRFDAIDEGFDILKKKRKSVEDLKAMYLRQKTEIETKNLELKGYSSQVARLKGSISLKEASKLEINVDVLRSELSGLEGACRATETDIIGKQETIEIDKVLVGILSDKGVKTFFMDNLLPVLNSKINSYLESFEFPVRVTINPDMSTVIETLEGRVRERPYGLFSGGERKMIDVSVWLAFIDSVKLFMNWNCNVLFIDELFDDGTDLETLEKILYKLRDMTKVENTHISIISHKNPDVKFDIKRCARKICRFSVLEETYNSMV